MLCETERQRGGFPLTSRTRGSRCFLEQVGPNLTLLPEDQSLPSNILFSLNPLPFSLHHLSPLFPLPRTTQHGILPRNRHHTHLKIMPTPPRKHLPTPQHPRRAFPSINRFLHVEGISGRGLRGGPAPLRPRSCADGGGGGGHPAFQGGEDGEFR